MGAGSNNLVTDGLVYCLDAANRRCYSGTGTTGADLVLGGTTTLTNTVTFGSNNIGVFAFDGTDDYIDQDWSFTLGTGDLTIEFWVKMEGWVIHSNGANVFLSVVDPDVHEELQFGIENSTAQRLALYLDGGSNGSKTGDGVYSWSTDQWYHLVATRISSTVALYRDGVSLTVATGATNTGDVAAISTFLLGNQYKSGQYKHDFQGDMGPIRIYNKGLTAAEVKQNYEATKSRFLPRIPKEGLWGMWDAGDPNSYVSGLTWKNTASGTVGTLVNDGDGSLTFDSANGGSLDFDGTDDYLNTNDTGFTSANGITGMVWVNLAKASTNVFFWKNHVFQFRYDSSQRLNFRSGGGSGWSTSADLTSAADLLTIDGSAWACVAASANKSNNAREMWLNGERVANDTGSGMGWGTNTVTLEVGGYTSHDWWTGGKIAMATLYERALSAAEIKDFYNKTKARFGH